jgi:hypothetical protein
MLLSAEDGEGLSDESEKNVKGGRRAIDGVSWVSA